MKRNRRNFLKTMGLGAAALSLSSLTSSCGSWGKRPNVIFIMSDDHAERAMSCYGSHLIETPNLDRIAHEGVRFNNSFVTNSICAPSRAVLLTGKYSHRNGLRDNRDEFDGSQVTFPKLLQRAGYQSFLVGKWHLKSAPTGFNSYKILIDQGEYYNPRFIEDGVERQYTGYTTDLIADMSLDVLKNRNPQKPFCLLVHHKAPHRNWMPNAKYMNAYDDRDLPLPDNFYDDYATRSATAGEADMRIEDMFLSFDMKLKPGYYEKETGTGGSTSASFDVEENWKRTYERLTVEQRKTWDAHYDRVNEEFRKAKRSGVELLKWKYQRYLKDYLSCVLSIDESVGRLLDYLDEKELAENTIVIYTSDQGFYLGEHGWYDKRFMYEESLSMPLIMRYPPEIQAGTVSEDMVLNLDFAPSILDFAGIRIPDDMQGASFRTILHGTSPVDWRKSMYYHYYEYPHGWHKVKRHYGIRTQRYKLIHFYHDIDAWELYDLEKDAHEMNNLYDHADYAEIVRTLKAELKSLQQKYGDTNISQD